MDDLRVRFKAFRWRMLRFHHGSLLDLIIAAALASCADEVLGMVPFEWGRVGCSLEIASCDWDEDEAGSRREVIGPDSWERSKELPA
jgi:hypothetical protein